MTRCREGEGRGGEGTLYKGLLSEARREWGTFRWFQVNERMGISIDEVYERVRKSIISVG